MIDLENEFISSWDAVEHFYKTFFTPPHRKLNTILLFIYAMRAKGFDRTLRAGTSLSSLGLSRSMSHGLRPGQPSVYFQFDNIRASDDIGPGMIVTASDDSEHVFATIELNAVVEQMLRTLEKEKID